MLLSYVVVKKCVDFWVMELNMSRAVVCIL